jgi:hypothetical protein
MKEKISITLSGNAISEIDGFIDNLTIRNRSQAIEYLITKALGDQRSAVILAGGPASALIVGKDYRITSKVRGSTVIELALRKLRENGFSRIYVVAEKQILTAVFDLVQEGKKYGVHIEYAEDQHSKGTAQSLRVLKGNLTQSFLVAYGDIIFTIPFLEGVGLVVSISVAAPLFER